MYFCSFYIFLSVFASIGEINVFIYMLYLTVNQWLQIDIGPPTLVTGVVTRGRGDGRRKHWVTGYQLSFSNHTDSNWQYYKDASFLHTKVYTAPTNNILVTYGALQVLYCIVLYCTMSQFVAWLRVWFHS